ncbi:hypothetical protein [Cellulomonas oligotrophica]|uniref:Uncharacterized protein n=1 Tax=Cellulomonas oligotrophica TaxID=931536 RepID=A0A7Y9FI39_9CELL|nr:hypothetical protein [Cellulomonas oligotrophica]NYD86371.1 hypothetical protein [Cellulomonas oligotrophica]GIG32738.1 hypothetical protein Col01nite_18970 [Cellulomonas oligotrophica]
MPPLNPFGEPLRLIGYWSGGHGARDWPDVRDFVDDEMDEEERVHVGLYLRNGLVARAFMGYSPCRLCDRRANGNLELTDGVYVWPEGLPHYVMDHSVRLPRDFVAHVEAHDELTDDVRVDESWWRSVEPPSSSS